MIYLMFKLGVYRHECLGYDHEVGPLRTRAKEITDRGLLDHDGYHDIEIVGVDPNGNETPVGRWTRPWSGRKHAKEYEWVDDS